jgi:hypothetical protein
MTVSGTDHEQSLISFSSFRGISQSTYDDFLSYLRGIPDNIHAALILREPNGSPNVGAIWHGRIPVVPISPILRCGS